jgi:uncharacterized membrane protein YgcG
VARAVFSAAGATGLLLLIACGEEVVTERKSAAPSKRSDHRNAGLAPLPPAPETQILDDGRVFARAPDELAEMERLLKELKHRDGIKVFVAMYKCLDGETVEERARRLREAWADRITGIVVVHDSGGADLSFVATDEVDSLLARHDINSILQAAGTAAQKETGARNQVRAAVRALADSLAGKLDRQRKVDVVMAKKRMLVIGATLAGIILVALAGIVIARFIGKANQRAPEFYHLPDARVGTRFGAPHGGGSGAEIRFK